MSSGISRRDFLRLAGMLPLSLAAPRWPRLLTGSAGQKNVIVVLFDTFSAFDISLYGYQRETTPNIDRLAKRAIVYRNHYAASNFTTSGTASLLTGTLPWTHRAIARNGKAAPAFASRTLFDAFPDYHRVAYTHNEFAFTLLKEFRRSIDQLVPRERLYIKTFQSFLGSLFGNDADIAAVSWARTMNLKFDEGHTYSLFLSHIYDRIPNSVVEKLQEQFPRGLPTSGSGDDFVLEQAIDWIGSALTEMPQPFLGYFHFLPPHAPYNPPLEYVDRFKDDGYQPVDKPVDAYIIDDVVKFPFKFRTQYDQFILYMDREFGRFYDLLDKAGLLKNTWLILTTDHGEMFERGIVGHSANVLYQPVIHIPLLIFEPGRETGLDVHTPTSAVDVMPTLAQLTGHPIPSWVEGMILPPFASEDPDPQRRLYALVATRNNPAAPLTRASVALIDGRYKLHYYFGYAWGKRYPDTVKLYDVQSDPEELNDLFSVEKQIGTALLNELKEKLRIVNQPYVR